MRGSLKPISATILCRSCHLRAPEMHSPVFRTQQREYLDVDNDSIRSVVFTLSLANLRVLCVCMHLIRSYLLSSGLHCVAINQHNAHEGVVNKISVTNLVQQRKTLDIGRDTIFICSINTIIQLSIYFATTDI